MARGVVGSILQSPGQVVIVVRTPHRTSPLPHSSAAGADTLERRISPGAFHDSGRKYDPPKCQPRTRSAIIDTIMSWVKNEIEECGMLWLYGPSGSRKSAISQALSQLCFERGKLAASLFFAKGIAGPCPFLKRAATFRLFRHARNPAPNAYRKFAPTSPTAVPRR